jgi:hypothetical protein
MIMDQSQAGEGTGWTIQWIPTEGEIAAYRERLGPLFLPKAST